MITGEFHFSTVPSPAWNTRPMISGPWLPRWLTTFGAGGATSIHYGPGQQGWCRYRYLDIRGKR